jgi:hypothetical protein
MLLTDFSFTTVEVIAVLVREHLYTAEMAAHRESAQVDED